MNSFITEIGPHLEALANVDKEAEKLIVTSQNKLHENASMGCGYGCLTSIAGCTVAVSSISSGTILWVLIIPMCIGLIIGSLLDLTKRKSVNKNIEKSKIKAKNLKPELERELKIRVREFMKNNPM